MYSDLKAANERIEEVRREYEGKGYENIRIVRMGPQMHIRAYNPKRKRQIDCHLMPTVL